MIPVAGLFKTATPLGHIVGEGSPTREESRNTILLQNVYKHWQNAVKKPQKPRPAPDQPGHLAPTGATRDAL